MEKREVIRLVLEGKRPPYVPWSMGFTKEAREKLQRHYGRDDLEGPLENHLLKLGSDIGFFDDAMRLTALFSPSAHRDSGLMRGSPVGLAEVDSETAGWDTQCVPAPGCVPGTVRGKDPSDAGRAGERGNGLLESRCEHGSAIHFRGVWF